MLRSSLRPLLAAFAAALICVAGMAEAQTRPRAAERVLAQARAATGGAGWNILRGVHETGSMGGVRYERWLDPIRYGARLETHTPDGKHVRAFNGAAEWQILTNGASTGGDDIATLARARTDAFFGVQGYFFPSRFDMRLAYVGVRQAEGRSYEVVRVQPLHGRPRELWFDSRTHLLGRIVDRDGAKPVTVILSDYRKVGPVTLAFKSVSDAGTASSRDVMSLDFRPADRGLFNLPPPAERTAAK